MTTNAEMPSQWFVLAVRPGLNTERPALLKRVPGIDEVVVPVEVLKKNDRLGQRITVPELISPDTPSCGRNCRGRTAP